MNSSRHRSQKLLGIILLLGLPICFVAAGGYSYYQPRLFSATTGFQLLYPDADTPQILTAFEKAQQEFAARPQLHLASKVSLHQSATANQFAITAIDAYPLTASTTANTLTIFVSDFLRSNGNEDGRRLTILQTAEMPKVPSYPNVQRIMTTGMALGILSAITGIFILAAGKSPPTSCRPIPW